LKTGVGKYSRLTIAIRGMITVGLFFVSGLICATTISYNSYNSPYYISSNLIFDVNDTVVFEEGAILIISPGVDIRIKGEAYFLGTASNVCSFLPLTPGIGWGRIYFDNLGIPQKDYYVQHLKVVDGLIDSHYAKMHISNVEINNSQNLLWDDNFIYIRNGWAKIDNCTLIGINDGEGIQFLTTDSANVTNSSFTGTPDAIELINVFSGKISGNTIRDILDDGIDLNHSENIIIQNNIISNATDRGLEIGSENFGSSTNILIENNIIYGCNEGVIFKEGSSGVVRNNTFYNNNYSLSCLELVSGSGASSVIVENTIFSNSITEDFQVDYFSDINISYSMSDNLILFSGDSNLVGNPMFENENYGDFSLMEGSPCIDRGNPNSSKDEDCTSVEIGALYYPQDGFCETQNFTGVQVLPSVFNEKAIIVYELKESAVVKLEIYDISGRMIRLLIDGSQEKGVKKIIWEEQYSSNIYIVRLIVNDVAYQTKAIQVKKG
jgi:parallel beta-helix repeat protein